VINIDEILHITILGTIQGIAEILPVSSTGHLILINHFLKIDSNDMMLFRAFIQLGSSLSLFILYKKKWSKIFFSFNKSITLKDPKYITLYHIFLSSIPVSTIGILFHSEIKRLYTSINVIFATIFGTLFLILANIKINKKKNKYNVKYISYLKSLMIGCIQCLALWPGFSRSGATISGAILLGYNKSIAIDFSFIVGTPILIGASIVNIIQIVHFITLKNILLCFFGFLITFTISIITMKKLLSIIKNHSFFLFIIYRFLLISILYVILFVNT